METRPEITCDVILDLLPMYQEGTCSEDTRVLVEGHLQGCAECRRLCEALPISEPGPAAEQPAEKEIFRNVQRRIHASRTAKALAGVAVVLIAGFAVWNAVWVKQRYLPYRHYLEQSRQHLTSELAEGKGTQYTGSDGTYSCTVKMPGYLGFESGFLCVQRCPGQEVPPDTTLFIYPEPGGGTAYMVMILDTRLSSAPRETILYGCQLTRELAYIPDPCLSDADNAYAEELLQNRREELAGMQAWAETVFGFEP